MSQDFTKDLNNDDYYTIIIVILSCLLTLCTTVAGVFLVCICKLLRDNPARLQETHSSNRPISMHEITIDSPDAPAVNHENGSSETTLSQTMANQGEISYTKHSSVSPPPFFTRDTKITPSALERTTISRNRTHSSHATGLNNITRAPDTETDRTNHKRMIELSTVHRANTSAHNYDNDPLFSSLEDFNNDTYFEGLCTECNNYVNLNIIMNAEEYPNQYIKCPECSANLASSLNFHFSSNV